MKKIVLLITLFTCLNVNAQSPRQTLLFNAGWKFYKGDIAGAFDPSFNDKGWRSLDLPHDWSIEGPFDVQWASATAYLPAGIGWYRKTFTLPAGQQQKNLFIYFDGVYKNSEVWINGHYLGKRPNGFIPFQYEITPYIHKTGNNTLAVKVDHSAFADSRWYTGSGIYRNVYLVTTSPVHADLWGVKFTTPTVSSARAQAAVAVTVVNQLAEPVKAMVTASLVNKQGKIAATSQTSIQLPANGKGDAGLALTVDHPVLWSPEHPGLYTLQVAVMVGDKKMDLLTQEVGIRTVVFDKDKGLFINGNRIFQKGVCIHDDAGALGVAVPEEVWARRLRILKEGGTNAIRLSHNPHADYLYQLFDRMGFLVMDEAFDEWEVGKNKWIKGWNVGTPGQDGYHSDFKEWADRDLRDMVLRDRNHPSVILWSIGNEIDYPNDPYTHPILNTGNNPQIYGKGYTPGHPDAIRMTEIAKQLVAVVKQNDTSRPVTAALAGVVMSNEVGLPEVLDIVGYNYQEFRYDGDHAKYPGRVIYGSENGMAKSAWDAVTDRQFVSGQYLWTGIDYMGEARQWPARSSVSGLLDLAGFTKPEYYFRQSLWSDKAMAYIGTSPVRKAGAASAAPRQPITPSWNYAPGDSVKVSCFTNTAAAELFLNGRSLGKKMAAEAKEGILTWTIAWAPGELTVAGFKNGVTVKGNTLHTAGVAAAIRLMNEYPLPAPGQKGLAQVEITLVDKKGFPVVSATNDLTLKISGTATLLGMESGSAMSHEAVRSATRAAMNGRLLAYIQTPAKPGPVSVTISSPGIKPATILLKAMK